MEKRSSVQQEHTSEKKINSFPFRVSSSGYLWLIGIFTLTGVVGGFTYYYFIGCTTGGCAITSSPYMSMLWGGAMGYLLPDFFIKKKENINPEKEAG